VRTEREETIVHLYDLTALDELQWLLANGYIREAEHPTEPLRIINYTDRAMTKPELFDQIPALNHCRGLIWNTDTGEIVARPFRKFWNYGQPQAVEIALDASVIVTDKVDGSLGILYRRPSDGRYAIATRGSFTSPQALHGTEVLQERYPDFVPMDDDTLLFEIVYPENRIVLDYGTEDNLFLLGAVEKQRGFVVAPEIAARYHGWEGPRAHTFVYRTLAEALAAPPRTGAEGMVVRQRGTDRMIKLKQEDYVRLHKIVFGLTEKSVWRAVVAGDPLGVILEPIPDEFHPWVREVYGRIRGRAAEWGQRVRGEYGRVMDSIAWDEFDERGAKAEFASFVKDDPDAWAYFLLYTGRGADIEQRYIEKYLEPVGSTGPSNQPKED
jgi:RNA ligase